MFSKVIDCGLHADCVKFAPNRRDLFVISCYELDEASGKRIGKLILANTAGEVLHEVTGIAGVFDFYWCKETVLALALAHGPPKLYEVSENTLREVPLQVENDFEMTLSISGSFDNLITSDNRGQLRVCQITADSTLNVLSEWTGHDAEIWYVSADPHERSLFYSGADDGVMRGWDCRIPSVPIFTDKMTHEAGVCCVNADPNREFILATGSYDERVRIWDRRALKQPLNAFDCASGAWRVVWNPNGNGQVAVAAMRAGFLVADSVDGTIFRREDVGTDAVAYGIDLDGSSVVSCSFYNNSCQVW